MHDYRAGVRWWALFDRPARTFFFKLYNSADAGVVKLFAGANPAGVKEALDIRSDLV
jgi:hypothetical protein